MLPCWRKDNPYKPSLVKTEASGKINRLLVLVLLYCGVSSLKGCEEKRSIHWGSPRFTSWSFSLQLGYTLLIDTFTIKFYRGFGNWVVHIFGLWNWNYNTLCVIWDGFPTTTTPPHPPSQICRLPCWYLCVNMQWLKTSIVKVVEYPVISFRFRDDFRGGSHLNPAVRLDYPVCEICLRVSQLWN